MILITPFFWFVWLFLCDICRYAHQCLKLVGVWPKCQNFCDLDLESGGFDGPKSYISLSFYRILQRGFIMHPRWVLCLPQSLKWRMGVSSRFSFLFGKKTPFSTSVIMGGRRVSSQVSESSRIYGSPFLSAGKTQAPGVWALDTRTWHPASLRGCIAGWYGTSTLVLGANLGAFLRL